MTASVNGLKEIISAVWNSIKMLISTGQNGIKNTVVSTWNAISDSIRNVVNSVKNTVSDVWNAMPDAVHGAMHNIQNTVLNIWDNIKNGVWDRVWSIRDTVAESINSAADFIRNIANSSWQWGYDLMQNSSPAGTVINNYNNDNSRTVNQTNNSPKSLSWL